MNNSTLLVCFLGFVILTCLLYSITHNAHEYYAQTDPMLHVLKKVLTPVHPVMSKLKLYKGDKSYTINKEKIFLCLKDENGEYYDLNMLVYVLLHEVAHLLNDENIGHTKEFYDIFDDLLEKAYKIGVYNKEIPVVKNYCGTT